MTTNMTNPTLPDVLISVADSAVPTYELSGWIVETPEQAAERVARELAEAAERMRAADVRGADALRVLHLAAAAAADENDATLAAEVEVSVTHPDGEADQPVDLEKPTK